MNGGQLFSTDTQKWQAVVQRDRRADGVFVYAVRTTGIFCRPVCSSRRPNRTNVSFHASAEEAESAGFRPCKRCNPTAPIANRLSRPVVEACRYIESASQSPTLNVLAQAVGLSPRYLHRLFTSTLGITPKAYANSVRSTRLRAQLGSSVSVTAAIYNAGYESASRCFAETRDQWGMSPAEYRDGAPQQELHFAIAQSDLGWIAVVSTPRGVCMVELADDARTLQLAVRNRFDRADLREIPAEECEFLRIVLQSIAEPLRNVSVPIDIKATAFQRSVWEVLQQIPPGTTRSYGEIAAALERPNSARAVAGACAANPLAVVIPCHRVVGKTGDLTGYRWGLQRKQALLQREVEAKAGGGT